MPAVYGSPVYTTEIAGVAWVVERAVARWPANVWRCYRADGTADAPELRGTLARIAEQLRS
jgi:hypothetical protein